MELVFGYLAGLLTLINPCVLPVLPIVLASALQADRRGPIALAAGMSIAFVTLGVVISGFGYALGISEATVARAGRRFDDWFRSCPACSPVWCEVCYRNRRGSRPRQMAG